MQGDRAVAHAYGGSGGAQLGEALLEAADVLAGGRDPRAADGIDDVFFFVARQVGAGDRDFSWRHGQTSNLRAMALSVKKPTFSAGAEVVK